MPAPAPEPNKEPAAAVVKTTELHDLKDNVTDVAEQLKSFMLKRGDSGKDVKRAEKVNFLIDQIELVNNRVEGLERAVDLGLPIARAQESVKKLDELSRNTEIISSRMSVLIADTRELDKKLNELEEFAQQRVSDDQIQAVAERLDYLEKLYKELTKSKSKAVLTDIAGIIDDLEKRLSVLETRLDDVLSTEVDGDVKGGSPKEKPKQAKPGLFDGITGFFSGLSGRLRNAIGVK